MGWQAKYRGPFWYTLLLAGTAAGSLAQRLNKAGWKIWVDRAIGVTLLALGFQLLWIA